MGSMNEDDGSVPQTAAEAPAGPESQKDARIVAERPDKEIAAEEWLVPGMEEAGYGYGV